MWLNILYIKDMIYHHVWYLLKYTEVDKRFNKIWNRYHVPFSSFPKGDVWPSFWINIYFLHTWCLRGEQFPVFDCYTFKRWCRMSLPLFRKELQNLTGQSEYCECYKIYLKLCCIYWGGGGGYSMNHKAKGTGVPTHDVTYFCLHFRSAPTVVHRKQWAAVTVCCVVGCHNSYGKTGNTVAYFKFPTDKEWRAKLVAIVNRVDPGFNPDTMFICSEHFEPKCFLFHGKYMYTTNLWFADLYCFIYYMCGLNY